MAKASSVDKEMKMVNSNFGPAVRTRGVLPYIRYIGMCRPIG